MIINTRGPMKDPLIIDEKIQSTSKQRTKKANEEN